MSYIVLFRLPHLTHSSWLRVHVWVVAVTRHPWHVLWVEGYLVWALNECVVPFFIKFLENIIRAFWGVINVVVNGLDWMYLVFLHRLIIWRLPPRHSFDLGFSHFVSCRFQGAAVVLHINWWGGHRVDGLRRLFDDLNFVDSFIDLALSTHFNFIITF